MYQRTARQPRVNWEHTSLTAKPNPRQSGYMVLPSSASSLVADIIIALWIIAIVAMVLLGNGATT